MRQDNINLQNALEESLLSEAKNNNVSIGFHRGGSSNCSFHSNGNTIVTGQIGIQKENPKDPAERIIGIIDILYKKENIDEVKEEEYEGKDIMLKVSKYEFYGNKTLPIKSYVLNENDDLTDIASDIVNHFKLN